jgi:hypothetical protein
MTTNAMRRHALIIGSQCGEMPHLGELDNAAAGLRDTLLRGDVGGCQPGLPNGNGLVSGSLAATEITAHIKTAIAFAAEKEACLILALLGHGFIPGMDPTLYFMGSDSQEGVRDSAVNVGQLIVEASDRRGIKGVLGIIDTCNAAASQPDLTGLTAGSRGGNTSVSLLYSSAVAQESFGFNLSQQVTTLLSDGMHDVGPHLWPVTVIDELKRLIGVQNVGMFTYDGDQTGERIWLSHNRRHRQPSPLLGPVGTEALHAALLRLGLVSPSPTSMGELKTLIELLDSQTPRPEREMAIRVSRNLYIAVQTTEFLRRLPPAQLQLKTLRAAFHAALPDALPEGLIGEADFTERIALSYPAADTDCRPSMVRFCVTLLWNADAAAQEALHDWVQDQRVTVYANETRKQLETLHQTQRLRLIVSLHAAVAGDWPSSLDAWLMRDNEIYQHEIFECAQTETAVESALFKAIGWADTLTDDAFPHSDAIRVRHIDLAAPEGLLVKWRPEEAVNGRRLGVSFYVIGHWSQRLDPPFPWVNRFAEDALIQIAENPDRPIDWLSAQDIRDAAELSKRLENGEFTRAIGLPAVPTARLLGLLLHYSPIVVWQAAGGQLTGDTKDEVLRHWQRLPTAMLDSYKPLWRGERSASGLAGLRAVWDDSIWLRFCKRWRNHRAATARSM